ALDVLLDFSEVATGQEEAEGLAMAVQDVGGGRIEFAELCPHLRHERLEGFGILRPWRGRWAGERRRVTQRGTHPTDECAQLVGQTSPSGLDSIGIATSSDRLFEGSRGRLDDAGAKIARHALDGMGQAL